VKRHAIGMACGLMVTLVSTAAASPAVPQQDQKEMTDVYFLEGIRAGAAAGFNARAVVLRAHLDQVAPLLDETFAFDALLLDGRVMPPILAAVEGERVLENGRLREAAQVFRILEPAQIVTTPPTWRGYVSIPDQRINSVIIPRAFRRTFREGRERGLEMGAHQADGVLASQLGELTRAYWGALAYLELHARGMVSAPVLGVSERGIVVEADRLSVDDKIFEVTLNSRFEKPANWRVVLESVR